MNLFDMMAQYSTAAEALRSRTDPTETLHWEECRKQALRRSLQVLSSLEERGYVCGVFGSALRPGDFFGTSDVDFSIAKDTRQPFSADERRACRTLIKNILLDQAFDTVFLPIENSPAFSERIADRWNADRSFLTIALSTDTACALRAPFTIDDVAFICSERLEIASNFLAMALQRPLEKNQPVAYFMHARACAESLSRILTKVAKDILRHWNGHYTANWAFDLFYLLALPPTAALLPVLPLLAVEEKHVLDELIRAAKSPQSEQEQIECARLLLAQGQRTLSSSADFINGYLLQAVQNCPKEASLATKTLTESLT